MRRVGRERELRPRQGFVGALHGEDSVLEDDVLDGGFHQMGGDLFRLGLDLVERLDDGAHADGAGTRAVGTHAELHLVGVAMDDLDLFHRNAEAGGDELRKGGFVALAVAVRTGEHLDGAGRH